MITVPSLRMHAEGNNRWLNSDKIPQFVLEFKKRLNGDKWFLNRQMKSTDSGAKYVDTYGYLEEMEFVCVKLIFSFVFFKRQERYEF